jgi:endonuclease/exonuclease/phosphatase family metal-dependent hydrolase
VRGMTNETRQAQGARLERETQETVMADIPAFAQAEIHNLVPAPAQAPGTLGVLVFNMERGVRLREIADFLRDCPSIQPFDVILANELDDGCTRSGNLDTARELAESFGLNYVYGLEFIELADAQGVRAHHGNAVFSRWPIRQARVVRLPEQYNWYFDRQRRIGGRNAVLCELEIGGRSVGVASVHLENRTHGEGRRAQMETVRMAAREMFPGMPVLLGGDLNTNTFDGRDNGSIERIAASSAARERCLTDVFRYEPLLPEAAAEGYRIVPEAPEPTRRKPLPDGGSLPIRLDWILLRGAEPLDSRVISTRSEDCPFARPGTPLAAFRGELSDHNAVWASCRLE